MTYNTGPSKSTTWITPQWIIDLIGQSDLDPCGYKLPDGTFVTQCAGRTYTLQDGEDGLSLPWEGTVYCNPPYDDNKTWLRRCREYHVETGNNVIVLMYNRSETRYFQEEVPFATGVLFPFGRIEFLDETGKLRGRAPAPNILLAYGDGAFERIRRVPGIAMKVCR
jgi:hypothetical protein